MFPELARHSKPSGYASVWCIGDRRTLFFEWGEVPWTDKTIRITGVAPSRFVTAQSRLSDLPVGTAPSPSFERHCSNNQTISPQRSSTRRDSVLSYARCWWRRLRYAPLANRPDVPLGPFPCLDHGPWSCLFRGEAGEDLV